MENIGSAQLYRRPTTLFHQTMKSNKQKKTPQFLKPSPIFQMKDCQTLGSRYMCVPKFCFCLRAHILSLATNIASYFPWCDGLTSFISIIYLPNTQVWTANLSKVVLLNKSDISRKQWHVQFVAPGWPRVHPWDNPHSSAGAETLPAFLPLHLRVPRWYIPKTHDSRTLTFVPLL